MKKEDKTNNDNPSDDENSDSDDKSEQSDYEPSDAENSNDKHCSDNENCNSDEHCDDEHCNSDEHCDDEHCNDEHCDNEHSDNKIDKIDKFNEPLLKYTYFFIINDDLNKDPKKDVNNDPKKDVNKDINKDVNKDNRKNKRKNDQDNKDDKGDKGDLDEQDDFMDNIFKRMMTSRDNKKKRRTDKDTVSEFDRYFKEANTLKPINKDIKTLKDLIELGKTYDPLDKSRYVINLRALNKCVEPLQNLEAMIGMNNIKEMIIDLIFFRLQNLEENKEEMWHLVIQGTPGSGKTEVAKIIGKLFYGLGIIKEDKFTQVRRSDLIGKYLGHTAKMTQDVFNNAKNGILFIDEAYSLGNPENKDSFSKECIDTINQNLTENKDTVVFIAGYKEQLDESFFSYNPGLNRRFKIRMTVDKYNAAELREIFIKKIKENKWTTLGEDYINNVPLIFFEKNMDMFKYNGGDMENLWHFTKIVHARRIFGKSNDIVKRITHEDIQNAFNSYSENDEFKGRNQNLSKYVYESMYC